MSVKKGLEKTEASRIVVFQEKSIRRILHNDEWWFSVIDVVAVLIDSSNFPHLMENREKPKIIIWVRRRKEDG